MTNGLDIRKTPLQELIRLQKPSAILEIGSWHGYSAVQFLSSASHEGLTPTITCIDTWLGSIEHWLDKKPNSEWSYDSLGVIDGEPSFIETFKKNVAEAGFKNQVNILRCPSEIGCRYLKKVGNHFDLIFIDGDHSYAGVANDLKLSAKLLSEKGRLSGDDWNWPGVRRAVLSFAFRNRLRVFLFGRTWLLLPDRGLLGEAWTELGSIQAIVELLKIRVGLSTKWKER